MNKTLTCRKCGGNITFPYCPQCPKQWVAALLLVLFFSVINTSLLNDLLIQPNLNPMGYINEDAKFLVRTSLLVSSIIDVILIRIIMRAMFLKK